MSQATKRKYVIQEVLGDFVTPTGNQQIVKVTRSRGNNLHEAITAQGETFLVSMPTKFRKNIWIKRGDYVIVDPIAEGEKVKAEISFILYKDQIQNLQKQQLWPEGFMVVQPAQVQTNKRQEKDEKDEEFSYSEDDDSDLFVNTNRRHHQYSESEEEDDGEEEDEDEEKRTENGS
ncbi:probable RNA-binding protein EIF1AD [Brachyistius frenatus]|uniref:probable RNA-binding protein EIF1AD n=1 Tax=Brachyistius frenatus TaxID=100188 RepID=UPI0037E7508D